MVSKLISDPRVLLPVEMGMCEEGPLCCGRENLEESTVRGRTTN